jgi:hypothetical protein
MQQNTPVFFLIIAAVVNTPGKAAAGPEASIYRKGIEASGYINPQDVSSSSKLWRIKLCH